MILNFISYLNNNSIPYRFTNGYEAIYLAKEKDQDYDILFKKEDFRTVDITINRFCEEYDYKLVQLYHQGIFAKNFFIVNPKTNALLNLDLYGELSRNDIKILNEKDVFSNSKTYKDCSILSTEDEFIQYLIKNIDKEDLTIEKFEILSALYKENTSACDKKLKSFFLTKHYILITAFSNNDYDEVIDNLQILKSDFLSLTKTASKNELINAFRIFKRVTKPTGFTICFLGPDGSGKSTVINNLIKQQLPFRRHDYFHLKPIPVNTNSPSEIVENPHEFPPYSAIKSYVKLFYFILQYNMGWLKNIFLLKRKSSLIIFDRYYDDLLVDYKRYRFGGNIKLAKWVLNFIPKPELYIILTADANVIYQRKQEVSLKELNRQVTGYRKLGEKNDYFNVDVNRTPQAIVNDVITLIMKKLNGRY